VACGGKAGGQGVPHRCSLLLGGASAAAVMKGPQRLRQRGPDTGAAVVAKGSRHSSSSGEGVLVAACAPVASVRRRQRARETKIYQVILG
jgi:hypothetical protein